MGQLDRELRVVWRRCGRWWRLVGGRLYLGRSFSVLGEHASRLGRVGRVVGKTPRADAVHNSSLKQHEADSGDPGTGRSQPSVNTVHASRVSMSVLATLQRTCLCRLRERAGSGGAESDGPRRKNCGGRAPVLCIKPFFATFSLLLHHSPAPKAREETPFFAPAPALTLQLLHQPRLPRPRPALFSAGAVVAPLPPAPLYTPFTRVKSSPSAGL